MAYETAIDLMQQDPKLTPEAASELLKERRTQGLSEPSALDNPAVNPGIAKLKAEQEAPTPKAPQSPQASR